MKSLKTIGIADPAWPAAEFWVRYEKGELLRSRQAGYSPFAYPNATSRSPWLAGWTYWASGL